MCGILTGFCLCPTQEGAAELGEGDGEEVLVQEEEVPDDQQDEY